MLVDEREALPDALRTEVKALMVRARAFVTRVHLALSPTTAAIYVDDKAAKPGADGSLLVNAGERHFGWAPWMAAGCPIRRAPWRTC